MIEVSLHQKISEFYYCTDGPALIENQIQLER